MSVLIDGIEYRPVQKSIVAFSLKEILIHCRKTLGYTLEQAGQQIGCSKSYLWKLENEETNLTLLTALRISRAYGVPLSSLAAALNEGCQ